MLFPSCNIFVLAVQYAVNTICSSLSKPSMPLLWFLSAWFYDATIKDLLAHVSARPGDKLVNQGEADDRGTPNS